MGLILSKFLFANVFWYEEDGVHKNTFDKSSRRCFIDQAKYISVLLLYLHTIYFPGAEIFAVFNCLTIISVTSILWLN